MHRGRSSAEASAGKGSGVQRAARATDILAKGGGGHGIEKGAPTLSSKTFASLDLSRATSRAISDIFGYRHMTELQRQTYRPMYEGRGVLARGPGSSGKRLAFLMPIVESLAAGRPSGVGSGISALIVAWSQRAAEEILEEAQVLLSYHRTLIVACLSGAESLGHDRSVLSGVHINILIATPPRIQEHIAATPGFLNLFNNLAYFTLDDAEPLLHPGNLDFIQQIVEALPGELEKELSSGMEQLRRISSSAASAPANPAAARVHIPQIPAAPTALSTLSTLNPQKVDQGVVFTSTEGMTNHMWAVLNFEIMRVPANFKIVVCFTTRSAIIFYAELFNTAGLRVLFLTGGESREQQDRVLQKFSTSRSAILFCSVAPAVKNAEVSAVIQVGMPFSRQIYVSRLFYGVSARCTLILHDFEAFFLETIRDMPIVLDAVDFRKSPELPLALRAPARSRAAEHAYMAWLSYYSSAGGLAWSRERLANEASRYAASIGALDDEGRPPRLTAEAAASMGLHGVPGVNIAGPPPP